MLLNKHVFMELTFESSYNVKTEKARRPTKPTLGSKKRRLESKTKRGSIKAGRGKVDF